MKILVIDDLPWNRAAAQILEEDGHEVTVLASVEEVWKKFGTLMEQGFEPELNWADFDLILTDLMMPMQWFQGALEQPVVNAQKQPVGLQFALCALNAGVPVIMVSDRNHHEDPMVALMDLMFTPQQRNGSVPFMTFEARECELVMDWDEDQRTLVPPTSMTPDPDEDGARLIKDWRRALQKAIKKNQHFKALATP